MLSCFRVIWSTTSLKDFFPQEKCLHGCILRCCSKNLRELNEISSRIFLAAQILADCSELRSHEVTGTVLHTDFGELAKKRQTETLIKKSEEALFTYPKARVNDVALNGEGSLET